VVQVAGIHLLGSGWFSTRFTFVKNWEVEAYWNRPRFRRGRQRNYITMKQNLLRGAGIAHVFCFTFLLLGFCQVLKAGPTALIPGYTVTVFANAPTGLTNPDSIAVFHGSVFVGYTNNTQPDGTGGDSTIVQFSMTGQFLRSYQVVGMCAGLKHNAFNGKLWVLLNPGANPALTLIDAGMFTQQDFTYAAPPLNGGGYDDAAFVNGQAYLSASNPTLQSGQNNFPSIVSATIVGGNKVKVSPVLLGNASLINIKTGKKLVVPQSDPESLEVDNAGNLVLDSHADGDLIFANTPGFPNQTGFVLPLSNGTSTQVTVEDTVFPTQASGTIYVVDTAANTVYAVTGTRFSPNSAFVTSDNTGVLGTVDLQTGLVTPVVTGFQSPHGALFVGSLPLVRLSQVTTVGGTTMLKGIFRVARTGDISPPLLVYLTITDSANSNTPSYHVTSVVIPAGEDEITFPLQLDSKGGFTKEGSAEQVTVNIEADSSYNILPNSVNIGVQDVTLPLPQ
jgi:hypothetical protein